MNAYDILVNHQKYAVIGLNDNPDKYAYKIYKKLKEKGKTVYGINPKYDEVDGDLVYNTLNDLPEKVDVAIFLVNPLIGINYLPTLKDLEIKTVWLQPGAEDEALIEKAQDLGLTVIEACVLALYTIHQ